MRRIGVVLLAAAALGVGLGQSAFAADMPSKAPATIIAQSWSGFYVGLHAGYAWGRTRVDENGPPGLYLDSGQQSWDYSVHGFIGGAQAGYNWQAGQIVLGVEADVGSMGLRGNAPSPSSCVGSACDTVSTTKTDLYGTLRARLGWAFDRTLIYATAGGIGVDTKLSTTDTCATPPCGGYLLDATQSKFRTGWTVGGGIEYAATDNWSFKAEYLYFGIGSDTVVGIPTLGGIPLATVVWEKRTTGNIVRAGVNYKFDWGR